MGQVNSINAEVTFPANVGDTAPQGRLTLGNIPDDDYTAVLQAIATDSDTEVIASPRILARDSQEALFSSVRDLPYTVVTVDGNTQTTLEDVQFLNVGITLIVLPRIHKDGLITMDTQLEISDQVDTSADGTPVIDRATAQSSVDVRDGGTVVLGGLRQRSRAQLEGGLPVLRKIPLLGGLFRNRRHDRDESAILLILRPNVMGHTQDDMPEIGAIRQEAGAALEERRLGERAGT